MTEVAPSPSASPAPSSAPVVASPAPVSLAATTTSPASPTPTPTPTPASTPAAQTSERPAYIPEAYWDATAGKVKDAEFAAHFNELQTRVAADESRRLTLPAKPEDYKIELPKDFTLPQGVEFKIDADNPLWAQGQQWAQKNGLTQEAFQEAIALVAGDRVGTAAQIDQARKAEIGKLGANGQARVTAIQTWAQGLLGQDPGARFVSRLFTAADVQMAESLIAKFTGSGTFKSGGREPPEAPGKLSDADYNKLSMPDRLDYARRMTAAAQGKKVA